MNYHIARALWSILMLVFKKTALLYMESNLTIVIVCCSFAPPLHQFCQKARQSFYKLKLI